MCMVAPNGSTILETSSEIPVSFAASMFVGMVAKINVYLAIFNLIPIPPFDGSRILFAFLPVKAYLKIMEREDDGFVISEKDLELRGSGEFFGTRQHGLPELRVANIFKHMKILKLAQQEARYIISEDLKLQNYENKKLKQEVLKKFENRLEEISLN